MILANSRRPEVHPAHYSARTFKLGAARYRTLVREIAQLIIEAEEDDVLDAGFCTFALIAFDGETQESQGGSQTINSFVPV